MHSTPEEPAQQAYRHRAITRTQEHISRSAGSRPTMIETDTKLSEMSDEKFIKAMMNYEL